MRERKMPPLELCSQGGSLGSAGAPVLESFKRGGKNPWKMSCEEQPCAAGAAEPSAPKGIFHLLIYGT